HLIATPASTQTLVIAGWGGPYESQLRKSFIPAFEAKYKAKVEWLAASSYQNYGRIKAERANPQIDIAMLDDIVLYQAYKDDLIAPLDASVVTNLADIQPEARISGDLGVTFGYNVAGLYYNTKVFHQRGFAPITSWRDLFRPEL